MSVIWSGITEEGAVVPVQVTAEGKVVAVGDGPEGEYLKLTGGNLTGDLTVNEQIELKTSGNATFAGDVTISSGVTGSPLTNQAACGLATNGIVTGVRLQTYNGSGETTVVIDSDGSGSATFTGSISCGSLVQSANTLYNPAIRAKNRATDKWTSWVSANGGLYLGSDIDSGSSSFPPTGDVKVAISGVDGSANFASEACGFTSTGQLYFTSGDTRYKLVVTDGVCVAEEFTRQMELKERADQFISDKKQTKPGTPQDGVGMDNDNA